ncbi:MAG: ADP-ribosylglycohydrolase family protein, partial [Methylobacter sp.]|nr:ADP-ribosylglycohydrolase family protein [Methylobacter sp.]
NHPLSNAATLTFGRIVNQLINGQDIDACKQEAELLINQYSEFAYSPYPGKASGYIVDTVQTVFHYFFSTDSFESCLIATVNQGADADTTGALVGMLSGAKYGVEQIPERWLTRLDQQVAGQIRQQTTELIRLAGVL